MDSGEEESDRGTDNYTAPPPVSDDYEPVGGEVEEEDLEGNEDDEDEEDVSMGTDFVESELGSEDVTGPLNAALSPSPERSIPSPAPPPPPPPVVIPGPKYEDIPPFFPADEMEPEVRLLQMEQNRFLNLIARDVVKTSATLVADLPTTSHEMVHQAMDMVWTIGLNPHIPIIFIRDSVDARSVFYNTGYAAVLFDFHQNAQKVMQGHSNKLSYIGASENRKWLISADCGKDSTLNVWDMKSGVPLKTYFDICRPDGVRTADMSSDAKFLAIISAGTVQMLSVWEWTVEPESGVDIPLALTKIDPKYGVQKIVQFSKEDNHYLMSCSNTYAIFYTWHHDYFQYSALIAVKPEPVPDPATFLIRSCFHFLPSRVVSCTGKGTIIVWDNGKLSSSAASRVSLEWHKKWQLLKSIVVQVAPLTFITVIDEYVVTTDVTGVIRFFDGELHLLNSIQACNTSIMALSFGPQPAVKFVVDKPDMEDLSLQRKPFFCRNFIFSTSTAVLGLATKNATKIKVILHESDRRITALASHPNKPHVCWGNEYGFLRVWHFKEKFTVNERLFEDKNITCLCYDNIGKYIGVGFHDGCIMFLDPITLKELWKPKFLTTDFPLRFCCFSMNGKYCAYADDTHAVGVIADVKGVWTLYGKYRAHQARIVDLLFTEGPDAQSTQLFSLGLDRMLAEYDLAKSTKGKLKLLHRDRVEQSALPMGMVPYPDITPEKYLLITNNQYKLKLINVVSRMCRKVALGPVYGEPIHRMRVLPYASWHPKNSHYVVFATGSTVGLQMLPPDGNPYSSMAVLAHPTKIDDIVCSYKGRFLFTLDGPDACIGMWEAHPQMLVMYHHLGGEGMNPYFPLIDGGREGGLFTDLQDYFYYIHLMKQGEDSIASRAVDRKVPVEEIPYIMRALGYFPTEYEVELMTNELKYGNYAETEELVTEIDIETFLKLYINHRPPMGLAMDDLRCAFEILRTGKQANLEPHINTRQFLSSIQTRGEHMTVDELMALMGILLEMEDPTHPPETPRDDDEEMTAALRAPIKRKKELERWIAREDVEGEEEEEEVEDIEEQTSPIPSDDVQKQHAREEAILNAIAKRLPKEITVESFLSCLLSAPLIFRNDENKLCHTSSGGDDTLLGQTSSVFTQENGRNAATQYS